MEDKLSVAEYMHQTREIRDMLSSVFGIPRTGKTETVVDATGKGICVSNGTTYGDLENLSFDKMVTFLGGATDTDNIHSLFIKVVTKLEDEPVKVKEEVYIPVIPQPVVQNTSKCEFCSYENSNPRAMRMHTMGKHTNRQIKNK